MLSLKIIIFLFILLSIFSCNQNNSGSKKVVNNNYAGYINNIPINLSEIDKTVQQELYDELYRIYIIRKTSLNEYFKEYMINSEAKKFGFTKKQYLEQYTLNNSLKINEFIKKNKLNVIPQLQRSFQYFDINSKVGKELVKESFKNYLIDKLIDSLTLIYKPIITLEPPIPPNISIENFYAHYRGNLNSQVSLIIVSDMECNKCKEYHNIYDSLFVKYKNKIKFGFIHYSSYVTLSAKASECAANQGKFWEMHDSIFNCKMLLDTSDIFILAQKLKLNMNQFKTDFYSNDIAQKLEYNFKILKAFGLYATPTVLINGKPVFDSSSKMGIENAINETLLYN